MIFSTTFVKETAYQKKQESGAKQQKREYEAQ
jgi:hypothetical protein